MNSKTDKSWVNKEDLIKFKNLGYTYDEIAEVTELNVDLIRNIVKKHSPEVSNASWLKHKNNRKDLPVDQIVSLRRFGFSQYEIACCFGVSKETIKSRLKEKTQSTGEVFSGHISRTLDYPENSMKKLYGKDKITPFSISLETGRSVIEVIKELNQREGCF